MGSACTGWSPLGGSRNLAGLSAPFLCVSVVPAGGLYQQPSAEPHGLRPVPWLVCQFCFSFWKSVMTWGFFCVTPARQLTFDPLCWVLHSCSVVFFVWQLCPFLKNIIFSFVTIRGKSKTGRSKGKGVAEMFTNALLLPKVDVFLPVIFPFTPLNWMPYVHLAEYFKKVTFCHQNLSSIFSSLHHV